MRNCSVTKKMEVVEGCLDDYRELAHFHYRDSRLGPFAAIYKLEGEVRGLKINAGVIVYTMPSPNLELRNVATDNFFVGFDRRTQLALINSNILCIGRVVIEPRFRGLGLAVRLVKETMGKVGVPIIEAAAVMGAVNPFFEKAGMTAFVSGMPARCVRLEEAFNMVGVEKDLLIDPLKVQQKLEQLGSEEAEFIEREITSFLQSYGKRRYSRAGIERTRYVLSKLTNRPVYYIWFREDQRSRSDDKFG